MPTAKTTKKKTVPKSTPKATPTSAVSVESQPRRLHLPAPKLFRLARVKHPVKVPNVWQLTNKTAQLLWQHHWLFLGLGLIDAILSLIFVSSSSTSTDVSSLKNQLSQGLSGSTGQVGIGLTVFTSLLASAGNNAGSPGGVYQIFLTLIITLATIWTIRKVAAGERIRLRDAFYKGMYPLIPFILVLFVVLLQLLPLLLGAGILALVISNGIAIYAIEIILWWLLFVVLACISCYMLCSSLFALYIVTLPDMTPMKALRSARQLVRYRRLSVFRKLFFLPVILFIVSAAIMVPIILLFAPLAQWVFFVLSTLAIVVVNTYMYTLYRELLE